MFTLFVFYSLFSVDGILFCNCNEVVVWCVWINLPCRGLFLTSLAFSISRLENLIRSRFDRAKFFNQFEIILIFPLEIVSVELNILEVQDNYLNLPPHPYDTILSWEIHSEPGRAFWFSHTVKGLPSFPFSFSTFPLYSRKSWLLNFRFYDTQSKNAWESFSGSGKINFYITDTLMRHQWQSRHSLNNCTSYTTRSTLQRSNLLKGLSRSMMWDIYWRCWKAR